MFWQTKAYAKIARPPARTKDSVLGKVSIAKGCFDEDDRQGQDIDSVLASAATDLGNISR